MNPRDRRAISLGVTVVALALLLLRVLPWFITDTRSALAQLGEHRALLARARADSAAHDSLLAAVVARRSAYDTLDADVLRAPDIASARRSFAADLNDATDTLAVRVIARAEVPDSATVGSLHRVHFRLAVESDLAGLVDLMRSIEEGPGRIARLSIRASEPGLTEPPTEVLTADLLVRAWAILPGSGSPGGGRK